MFFKKRKLLLLLIVVSLMFTACAANNEPDPDPGPGPDPELVPTEVPEEPPATFTAPPPTPEFQLPTPTAEPEDDIPETGEAQLETGAEIYLDACAGCHQNDGNGVEGVYPALNGNPFVTADEPRNVIAVVITGRGGMPTFHEILEEEEIAAVLSFVRSSWDNNAGNVSVQEVNQVWEETGMPQEEEEEEDE